MTTEVTRLRSSFRHLSPADGYNGTGNKDDQFLDTEILNSDPKLLIFQAI